jgi:hypothetical protein
MALLAPVLIGIFWLVLSASIYFWGRTAALAIAQTGATAAATEQGTADDCHAAAASLLAQTGDALVDVSVSCSRTSTEATATVTGSTLSLVPGWTPRVTQSATVPAERLT